MKHSWLTSISAAPETDLSTNLKTNLKSSGNNNYYIFDASTKTISHAEEINEDDEWEWEYETEPDAEKTNAETLFAQLKPASSITHQQVQNKVNEMKNVENQGKKRKSDEPEFKSKTIS